MRGPKELQDIEDSMVGNILVGDLLGKEDVVDEGFDGSLPLLLVGNSQGVLEMGGLENVFVLNAHKIFLEKVFLSNLSSIYHTSMTGAHRASVFSTAFSCVESWKPWRGRGEPCGPGKP